MPNYYSGIGAQLGVAEETTWSTRVAPTRFYEPDTEAIKAQYEFVQGKGLRPGQRVIRSDRRIVNKKGAGGPVDLAVLNKSMGLMWKHWLGVAPVVTTPMGGTNARLHTYNAPGDPTTLGLSVQVGRPDTAGVVDAFDYTGGKIVEGELDQQLHELLLFKPTFDFYDESAVNANSLAAASFTATMAPYAFSHCSATIAGAAFLPTKVTFKYGAGLNLDRFFLRTDTRKKEPVPAAMAIAEGTLEGEWAAVTQYNNFIGTGGATPVQSNVTLVLTWDTGIVIEGAYNFKITLTLNAIRYTGETPTVQGPGIVTGPLPFVVLDDGVAANPIVLTYQTTDTVA